MSARILVVNDNEVNVELLAAILARKAARQPLGTFRVKTRRRTGSYVRPRRAARAHQAEGWAGQIPLDTVIAKPDLYPRYFDIGAMPERAVWRELGRWLRDHRRWQR